MEVLRTHFVLHKQNIMGQNYKTVRKVYESFSGEFVMEIQGKTTQYARISELEFKIWKDAFSEASFLKSNG